MNVLILSLQFLVFQLLFRLLVFVVKLAVRALVYSPQLLTAYLACQRFLTRNDSAQTWLLSLLSLAITMYVLTLLLKALLLALKQKGHGLWLPVFLLLLTYTCLLPVWLLFPWVKTLMTLLDKEHASWLSFAASVALALYIYSHYNLLDAH
jgi:hypothetical protein